MWSGSKHDNTKLPVLTGRRPGRHARDRPRARLHATRATTNRKLCSLYLSLMDRMGVKLDRFGDADERLAGL